MSISSTSSIEAIDEIEEEGDEGWEVIQNPQIEIERKFIVPDNYHERLTAQGFKIQQEFDEILLDKYYDIYEHSLMKEDHWLRQRNGDWELKYPVGDVHSQVRKKMTVLYIGYSIVTKYCNILISMSYI
jgi:adenylate cyclase class IV